MDASMSGGTPDAGAVGPSPAGQGPNAEGTVVFSRDFEDGSMAGLSRSPNGLPEDRIQIEDDPTKQRGKVMRITYKAGDNFRTSGGTQPRSWLSSAMGYTVKQGKTVSGLKQAIYNAAKTDLDKAVAAGRVTAAQETSMLSGLQSHLDDIVNSTGPPPLGPPPAA